MGPDPQSFRNVGLSLAIAAIIGWTVCSEQFLAIPMAFTFLSLFCGFKWLTASRPLRNEAPDVLASLFQSYFGQDGICFAARLTVESDLCWFHVFHQNRFTRDAHATLYFVPMEGVSKAEKVPHEVPPVAAELQCGGGEAGVTSIPYPIARSWQGKLMIYEVFAKVRYPNGKGNLIRSREGLAVGEPSSELSNMLITVGLLAFGHIRITSTASMEVRLPSSIVESLPPEAQLRRETLWQPDPATGEFPVWDASSKALSSVPEQEGQ